jgi:hypothetical protein
MTDQKQLAEKHKELVKAEKLLTDYGLMVISKYNKMMISAVIVAVIIIGIVTGFFIGVIVGRMG